MEFLARITPDHRLELGQRNKAIFYQYLKEHPGMVLKITPVLPESAKQRRWFEGGLVPLITFYQEGMDHRSHEDCERVREWLKQEFNGEMVDVGGKVCRIAKSTKGRDALQPFLERVINWLVENYTPPQEALDPGSFKVWHDTVFPSGGPDNYIDYLNGRGIL